ncbi:MAG: glycosyltransferase family 39 protein [bacterium]|nr:glycosyltransferase family 39 protein [bacterium]
MLWQAALCGLESAIIPMHGPEGPYASQTSWLFEANGWLYYIIARFFRLFGAKLLFLRLVSCVFYLGASVLVYFTAKSLGGYRAGVFSLLFYALSAMSLSYAHFCKFYALGVFLAVLSVFLLVKMLHSKEKKYRYYYLLVAILAPAAMMLNIVIIAGEWIYVLLFVHKRTLKNAVFCSTSLSCLTFFLLWASDMNGLSRVADGTLPANLIWKHILVLLSVKSGTEIFSFLSSNYAIAVFFAAIVSAMLIFVKNSLYRKEALLVTVVFIMSCAVFVAFSLEVKNICTLNNEVIFIPMGAIILGSAVAFINKRLGFCILGIIGYMAGSLGYINGEELAPKAALEQMRAFPGRGAIVWDKSLFADSNEVVEEMSALDIEKVNIEQDIFLAKTISSIPYGYFWIVGSYYPDTLEELLAPSQQVLKIYCIRHLDNNPIYFVRKMK